MSLVDLMASGLPLNRKEKYYTGTVFPGIVCAENFAHFNAFATLLPGKPRFKVDPHPATTNIQFFTEYSPLHSFIGDAKARMLEVPASNETPDVAIILDKQPDRVLIVLEAKVFDGASAADVAHQLKNQEPFIKCVRASVGVDRVFHAALIPEGLLRSYRHVDFPVITWDSLHRAYERVIPDNYFLHVLGYALQGFESLRSTPNQARGQNAESRMTGAEIQRRSQEGSLEFRTMGRLGGLYGPDLARDFESGRWRSFLYEVRRDSEPINRNWLRISDFVSAIPSARAVARVTKLASKGKMLGAEILRQHQRGTLWYKTVGRNRGLYGPEFAEDVRTGRWKSHNYEVSTSDGPENRNWFSVEDFARAVGRG